MRSFASGHPKTVAQKGPSAGRHHNGAVLPQGDGFVAFFPSFSPPGACRCMLGHRVFARIYQWRVLT